MTATIYNPSDVVSYNGSIYTAVTPFISIPPSSPNWIKYIGPAVEYAVLFNFAYNYINGLTEDEQREMFLRTELLEPYGSYFEHSSEYAKEYSDSIYYRGKSTEYAKVYAIAYLIGYATIKSTGAYPRFIYTYATEFAKAIANGETEDYAILYATEYATAILHNVISEGWAISYATEKTGKVITSPPILNNLLALNNNSEKITIYYKITPSTVQGLGYSNANFYLSNVSKSNIRITEDINSSGVDVNSIHDQLNFYNIEYNSFKKGLNQINIMKRFSTDPEYYIFDTIYIVMYGYGEGYSNEDYPLSMYSGSKNFSINYKCNNDLAYGDEFELTINQLNVKQKSNFLDLFNNVIYFDIILNQNQKQKGEYNVEIRDSLENSITDDNLLIKIFANPVSELAYSTAYEKAITYNKTQEWSESYSIEYATQIEKGKTPVYSTAYASEIADGKPIELANVYAISYVYSYNITIKDNKTPEYSEAYAKLMLEI